MNLQQVHILTYRLCLQTRRTIEMCDNRKETVRSVRGDPDRDVDDLIFQDEPEWLVSER